MKGMYNNKKNVIFIEDTMESLDCIEGHEFIVPIFTKPEKSFHCGCGVIVDGLLITAGHVAKDQESKTPLHSLYVLFHDKFISLLDENIIYDGRNNDDRNGIHDDLIVYSCGIANSPFVLNGEPISEGLGLYTWPIDYDDDTGKMLCHGNECTVTSLHASPFNCKNGVWSNCFIVNNPGIYQHGNSGSALYRKNEVYGILLGGGNDTRMYKAMDANYIKQKINSCL